MNNKGADQTARMHRLVCAFVVLKPLKTGFLAMGPFYSEMPVIYALTADQIRICQSISTRTNKHKITQNSLFLIFFLLLSRNTWLSCTCKMIWLHYKFSKNNRISFFSYIQCQNKSRVLNASMKRMIELTSFPTCFY